MQRKLTLILAGSMLATLVVFIILLLGSVRATISESADNELRRYAVDIASLYGSGAEVGLNDEKKPFLKSPPLEALKSLSDAQIYYQGLALYNTGAPKPPPAALDLPESLDAGELTRVTWKQDGARWNGYAYPVMIEDEVIGTIVVAREHHSLQTEWKYLALATGLVGTMVLIMSVVMARALSRTFTSPIMAVIDASRQVASGDYNVRMPSGGGIEELEDLSQNFARMAKELARLDDREKQFFMSITHELKTPLTTIQGHAQMLEDLPMDEADRKTSISVIRSASKQLERLIGDVIDLARLRGGRFDVVPDTIPVMDFVEELQRLYPSLIINADEDLAFVADGGRTEQILINLLENAQRYKQSKIELNISAQGSSVIFALGNDGPPPPNPELIFEAFYSDKKGGSMGLGLTISRALAQAMHGNLSYETRQGPTFILTLPKGE